VVGLVIGGAGRRLADDLAEGGRVGIYVDDGEEVAPSAGRVPGPDVEETLPLPFVEDLDERGVVVGQGGLGVGLPGGQEAVAGQGEQREE
jgi:hypothetical protein